MKFKTIILIVAVICCYKPSFAQNVLVDKQGVAHFFSEAPIEDIEAVNKKAVGAINLDKGEVAVSIVIRDFHFDKSLMEEHFNENYMESEKFPKASYKGKIINFSELDFTKPGAFKAITEGELDIHGIKRPMTSEIEFQVSDDSIEVETSFDVELKDHEIKIPRMLIRNIAEVIDVDVKFNFMKK